MAIEKRDVGSLLDFLKISYSLAREIRGHPTINQGISLTNLFNQEVIDKIAKSAWGRF